jgi:hypothetical protein
MGVLDGKNILKQHKTIITGVFLITFFLRFLCFYNVPGITTRNGWAAPIHSKEIFFIAVITFLIATWGIKLHTIRLLLQLSSLAVILYCEKIFVDYFDYKLTWTTYGLWLNIAIIIVLQMYCIYIAKSNNINTVN